MNTINFATQSWQNLVRGNTNLEDSKMLHYMQLCSTKHGSEMLHYMRLNTEEQNELGLIMN